MGPFLAMTAEEGAARRRKTALRATIVAGGILLAGAGAGHFIFSFYGITIPALKIAGGILLFFVAFDMLHARPSRSKATKEEQDEGSQKEDVAVFPLGIPLLAGPGSLVSVLMLADQANSAWKLVSLYLAIVVTAAVIFLTLSQAPRLFSLLGQIGINVLSRLMGLILAAIAIQFTIDGLLMALPGLKG